MYTVTVPLIQVATDDGVAVQVTKGGPVPSNITDEALANLIDLGYVEKAEDRRDGPPAKSAPRRSDWEAYARSQGATDEDLDGVTKDDLIAAYGGEQA
jgi:hypothetical protein